jgi:EAL domain-containing protein (putative c-di-GMP-specific phosphodiesterase class I)
VIGDQVRFADIINQYRGLGVGVAIDDFGAGYAGLSLLANFQPDQIKLDMDLIRGIDRHGPRQAIVRALIQACSDLGIEVISEGVETVAEYEWLAGAGVQLFQGYLFAKPGFESFPSISRRYQLGERCDNVQGLVEVSLLVAVGRFRPAAGRHR